MYEGKSIQFLGKSMAERCAYIGWSNDSEIRYRATSGGVGTTLVKYAFDKGLITHTLSFEFDNKTLRYYPVLVDSFSDYKITASIYQEMDMWPFFFEKMRHEVVGDGQVLVFCLPCQAVALRKIAERNAVRVVLIGLTCSSQQDFAATRYLLKRLGIALNEVSKIQYRGNGWPSGVQITRKKGETIIVPNLDSIWTRIFHSRLFIPKRCFQCSDTLNSHADISLADPWLSNYIKTETIGKTLVRANTETGKALLQACQQDGYLTLATFSNEEIIASQRCTIERKIGYAANKAFVMRFTKLFSNPIYRGLVLKTRFGFRLHERLKAYMEDKAR